VKSPPSTETCHKELHSYRATYDVNTATPY
jgi:hypothetical protein